MGFRTEALILGGFMGILVRIRNSTGTLIYGYTIL